MSLIISESKIFPRSGKWSMWYVGHPVPHFIYDSPILTLQAEGAERDLLVKTLEGSKLPPVRGSLAHIKMVITSISEGTNRAIRLLLMGSALPCSSENNGKVIKVDTTTSLHEATRIIHALQESGNVDTLTVELKLY